MVPGIRKVSGRTLKAAPRINAIYVCSPHNSKFLFIQVKALLHRLDAGYLTVDM
jgi:hypothetical protein